MLSVNPAKSLKIFRNQKNSTGFEITMKIAFAFIILSVLLPPSLCEAQRSGGSRGGVRPTDIGAGTLPIGSESVMWYTTWDTALNEAARSNRPIFFMAAAATCSGISGVF